MSQCSQCRDAVYLDEDYSVNANENKSCCLCTKHTAARAPATERNLIEHYFYFMRAFCNQRLAHLRTSYAWRRWQRWNGEIIKFQIQSERFRMAQRGMKPSKNPLLFRRNIVCRGLFCSSIRIDFIHGDDCGRSGREQEMRQTTKMNWFTHQSIVNMKLPSLAAQSTGIHYTHSDVICLLF